MPEGRFIMPRIRMPKVGRSGRDPGATTEQAAAPAAESEKPNEAKKAGDSRQSPASEPAPAGAKPGAANPATVGPGATTPDPKLHERMEGLQGWMADIERKQARITYLGGLAVLLALAAAGVALYFGLTNHSDSAKKSDLDALSKRVESLEGAVTKNSKDTQKALNASVAQLQQTISGLQKQQQQAQATISSLQSQVASVAAGKNAAAAATTTTPGAGQTTTTPNTGKNP